MSSAAQMLADGDDQCTRSFRADLPRWLNSVSDTASAAKQVGEGGRFHKARREGYTTVVTHPDSTKEMTHYRPVPGSVALDQDMRAYVPDPTRLTPPDAGSWR